MCCDLRENVSLYEKTFLVCVCVCVRLHVGGRVCECVCVLTMDYSDSSKTKKPRCHSDSSYLLRSSPSPLIPAWHLLSPLSSLPYILSLIPVSPVVLFPYPTLRLTDSRRFILIWMKVELLFLQAKHTHTQSYTHILSIHLHFLISPNWNNLISVHLHSH